MKSNEKIPEMSHNEKKLRKTIEFISNALFVASVIASVYGAYVIVKSAVELIALASESAARPEIAAIISEFFEGLVLAVHYFLVAKFFIDCLKHGVPFTHKGAKEIRTIGLETIFLPMAVDIITLIAFGPGYLPHEVINFEVYELVFGIFIFQTGYVIDYGTHKIETGHHYHKIYRYLEAKYPDIIAEAEANIVKDVETKFDMIIE